MKWLKGLLVVVAAFSFAVSVSLALLNVMGLVQGNTLGNEGETIRFIAKQFVYSICALAFLYLIQRPSGISKVKASFRNRKWVLGVGALVVAIFELLLLQTPFVRGPLESVFPNGYPGAPILLAIYLGLLGLLARFVWRCPNCGVSLPFLRKSGKGLGIKLCPNCNVELS